jgi:uncharacterized protein (TIGR02284 family)
MNTRLHTEAATADVVRVLQRLLEACMDGEQGYADTSRTVQDPAMKTLLSQNGYQRAVFVQELEHLIGDLGGQASRRPSPDGAPFRGWADPLPRARRGDRMVLADCDLGETAARKAYEAAMRDVPLAAMPAGVRGVVQRQYAALLRAHALIQKHMWAH